MYSAQNKGTVKILNHTRCVQEIFIPHICHFWYATIFLGLWKVRQKVRKFGTKIAPQQNSVNEYFEILIQILQIISIYGIFLRTILIEIAYLVHFVFFLAYLVFSLLYSVFLFSE